MELNCPNCGGELGVAFARAKVVDCDYCSTTVFLQSDGLLSLGTRGEMHEEPCLITLDQPFRALGQTLVPVGHARFSYGRGTWDEFWCLCDARGYWVSVDEGDISVERPLASSEAPKLTKLNLGDTLSFKSSVYTVTEVERAECVAIRGSLPEIIRVGDSHSFVNLQDAQARQLSLEVSEGEYFWMHGRWVDPFDIVIL